MCFDPVTALTVATAVAAGYGALSQGAQAQAAANTNAALAQREGEVAQALAERNARALEQRAGERTQVAE
ncbi:hypothetical protein, partial [Falsiroseomonas oryzae]|uniref:hypothetical protein n=1 Tax=Falsiroseomonas oryzae TaxID=2766473 RepID=UPI0022EAA33F